MGTSCPKRPAAPKYVRSNVSRASLLSAATPLRALSSHGRPSLRTAASNATMQSEQVPQGVAGVATKTVNGIGHVDEVAILLVLRAWCSLRRNVASWECAIDVTEKLVCGRKFHICATRMLYTVRRLG